MRSDIDRMMRSGAERAQLEARCENCHRKKKDPRARCRCGTFRTIYVAAREEQYGATQ